MTESLPRAVQHYRLGTRGSALALAQASVVTDRLQALGSASTWHIEIIRTEGDVDKVSPLTEIGGRGVFTNALQTALLCGEIDGAVHSAKDVPTTLHHHAPIVAFPERDDPRDVLVSRHGLPLEQLPADPIIGTSSRRREAQILRLRPDARIVNLRGNIDTRLRKAATDDLDAIVLAAAGVRRMGWEDRVTEYFPVEQMVPAPGQGALAIQSRLGSESAMILTAIDDPAVSTPVRIEREFLAALGAGCTVPVGAFARVSRAQATLLAMLANLDAMRVSVVDECLDPGQEAEHAAEIASRMLRDVGIADSVHLWNGWHGNNSDLAGARVIVTRPREQAATLIRDLTARGAEVLAVPTIRIAPVADPVDLDTALREAVDARFDWIAFTSVNAVNAVADRLDALGIRPEQLSRVSVAAVGKATADAAGRIGLDAAIVPDRATADELAAALEENIHPGERVLFPRSAIGRETLPQALRARGVEVVIVDAYQTLAEPDVDADVMDQIHRRAYDVVTFTSPSSVRQFVQMLGEHRTIVTGSAAICAGPTSARAAEEEGFLLAGVADDSGSGGIAEAVAAYWRRRLEATESHLSTGVGGRDMSIATRSAD